MSAPRFYSMDDFGSPGRALTGNLQNKLKQILVPSLVTGYGGKPGAGWTLEHEHSNGFTLSNGSGYINFVSDLPGWNPHVITVFLAETLADTTGAIIGGDNLCSYTFRQGVNTDQRRQLVHAGGSLINYLATLRWIVVADEKSFALNVSAPIDLEAGYYINLYAGDAKNDNESANSGGAFNFVSVSQEGAAPSSPYEHKLFSAGTALRNLETGLVNLTGAPIAGFPVAARQARPHYPEALKIPKTLPLQNVLLDMTGIGFVGALRGVVFNEFLSGYSWKSSLRSLGFTGNSLDDRCKVVTLNGIELAYAHDSTRSIFFTTDPRFW